MVFSEASSGSFAVCPYFGLFVVDVVCFFFGDVVCDVVDEVHV